MSIRTYTELSRLESIDDRFDYLALDGVVGEQTFGDERWVNQKFYHSTEWRRIRSYVIARDLGFDLGVENFDFRGAPLIHHMNPMSLQDIEDGTSNMLDPEFLITTSHRTHNAIHYGDRKQLLRPLAPRVSGDTRLW